MQISYDLPDSPKWGRSLSASQPFDWAAARGLKAAPYATPAGFKRIVRKSAGGDVAPKAYIRKKNFIQRCVRSLPFDHGADCGVLWDRTLDLPERSMQKLVNALDDFPMPSNEVQAVFLGGALHLTHLVVRVSSGWTSSTEDALMAQFGEGPWIDGVRSTAFP